MPKARYYSLKQTPESRLYWRNGQEAIEQLHTLLDTDVILVSIDVEGTKTGWNGEAYMPRIDEIGISMLDTRHLGEKDESEIVLARHICTQTREIFLKGRSFLFGESEYVPKGLNHKNIVGYVRKLFYIEDIQQTNKASDGDIPTSISKKYRDIVLVGHGMQSDMHCLAKLGIDVKEILPIVAVVDTWLIGQPVFGLERGQKLVDLLACLGCPSGKMHNAGNDAVFTMRALLAMAVRTQWKGSQSKLSQIQRVAYAPVQVKKILSTKLEQTIASQRASNVRERQDQNEDWADILDQLNIDAD